MEVTGGIGCRHGSLDPRAQEFRPRNNNPNCQPLVPATFYLPPPVFYPYAAVSPSYIHGGGYPPYTAYLTASPLQQLPPPLTAATRTVVLTSVPVGVSEMTVRREMEVFGEVRAVQMEMAPEGVVSVHFYDLRHARRALREIRDQHVLQQCRRHQGGGCSPLLPPAPGLIAGHAVWAQYTIPAGGAIPNGQNQGTIVIFNLNPDVTPDVLREIFEPFGPVKEFRDTPYKKHQKFVEFYDVRDAAKALNEMNGRNIHGRNVVIEFSRPGGHSRKFLNAIAVNSLPPPPPLQFMYAPMVNQVPHASPNGNGAPIEARFAGLTLGFDGSNNYHEKQIGDRKKKHSGKCFSATVKQQQQSRCRPWKCRKLKKFDTRFVVSDGGFGETRTTLMIKNIPNKYSQKLFLNMLDAHCINCNEQIGEDDENDGSQTLSSYDFVYLPIDFNNKCNVGYGFVNMTSPAAARQLYKAFHLRPWEVFNSRKICEVTYARIQGLEALKEHFKNSKFPGEMDLYLPVVFSPPRDGKQLTEPLAVVGHRQTRQSAVEEEAMSCGGVSSIVSSRNCSYYSSSSNGGDNGDDEKIESDCSGVTDGGGRVINEGIQKQMLIRQDRSCVMSADDDRMDGCRGECHLR